MEHTQTQTRHKSERHRDPESRVEESEHQSGALNRQRRNIATKPPPQVRRSKNSREANQNDSLSGDQHEKVKEQQNDNAERVVPKREETTLGEARRAQTAKARNKSQTAPQGRGRANQMDSERSKRERAGSASRRRQKILLGGTRRAPKRSCGTHVADRVAEPRFRETQNEHAGRIT